MADYWFSITADLAVKRLNQHTFLPWNNNIKWESIVLIIDSQDLPNSHLCWLFISQLASASSTSVKHHPHLHRDAIFNEMGPRFLSEELIRMSRIPQAVHAFLNQVLARATLEPDL